MITEEFRNKLKDDYSGPHGYVIIKDKAGKILVNKPNMILKDGRDFLFGLFKNTILKDNNEATKYSLSKAIFTNETDEVSFTDNYDRIKNSSVYKVEIPIFSPLENALKGASGAGDSVVISTETIESHNCLKFAFTIGSDKLLNTGGDNSANNNPNTSLIALSSLYLVLVETDNDSDASRKCFSRIVFDSIPIQTVEELAINYYIYF